MPDPAEQPIHHSISLMPKQAEFVSSNRKQILYSGAFGAGKTRAACFRALFRAAQSPTARVGLCRKTLVALKSTTLVTLLEADGDLPPVLEGGSYVYHKTPGEERIKLHGGGVIILFGCDNPEKIASMPMSDCIIDEAIELDREEWNMLVGRIRVVFTYPGTRAKHIPTLAGVCNPGAPGHFLHDIFFKDPQAEDHLIQTSTLDNYFLDPGYVRELVRTYTGAALLRYVKGEWCIFEGAVYPMYSVRLHNVHRPGPWERYVGGVDFGFRNPMALRVHGVDTRNHSHVVTEYYKTEILPAEFVDICLETAKVYSPIVFVVDPSAAGLISEMRKAGLSVVSANNDVLAGIGVVQNALAGNEESRGPRFTMEPTCVAGNREYLAYQWKNSEDKDAPIKLHDHACFGADTLVMMGNGFTRKISEIREGDVVMTPLGPEAVQWAGVTDGEGPLLALSLEWASHAKESKLDLLAVTAGHEFMFDEYKRIPIGEVIGGTTTFLCIDMGDAKQGPPKIEHRYADIAVRKNGEAEGDLYCLTVPCGWFVLDNCLVAKNCDADRYALMYINKRAGRRRLTTIESPSRTIARRELAATSESAWGY